MPRLFTDSQLASAVGPIRSYDAVVIVGAGISALRFPLTRELPVLLWQALDSSPGAGELLRLAASRDGTAKEILSEDPGLLPTAWSLLRQFEDARQTFQVAFATLDIERDPSQAHIDLARMIKAGHVECVVSYNWDTCLERAYEYAFGVRIPEDVLYKPHGDAAYPGGTWTLPDEAGIVPHTVLNRIRALSNRPRTLMVIGYSGSDEAVVDLLLAPLASRWPVVRIGPSATGEGAIPAGADEAIAAIVDAIGASTPFVGWRYVTFDRSRDFGAALRGERLRPVDVDACPELPAAARIADRLQAARFATVSGPSGSGKSITAFHAARRLNHDGWAVVERRGQTPTRAHIEEFAAMDGPVLAVVDDAQALDQAFLEDLREIVNDDHAVLFVSTARLEDRSDETLIASQTQQILYKYCMQNVDMVGRLITQLDDRVRWSAFASETPEQRIEVAQRTTSEPWLFMFVASGGERRIASALDRVVESSPAAIALVWICILQMTSRDAGVSRDELQASLETHVAETYVNAAGEFRSDLLNDAIGLLAAERLIGDQEGRIRAAHVRIAERALNALGLRFENGIGYLTLRWIRQTLLDTEIPMSGKLWLFRTFDRSEAYRSGPIYRFADEEVTTAVLGQLEASRTGFERGAGLNLFWSIDFVRTVDDEVALRIAASLIAWLPDIGEDEVNGFRWILSGLRSSHEAAYELVRTTASARALAQSVSNRGTRNRASDWGDVIRELKPDSRSAQAEQWVSDFEAGIVADALTTWLGHVETDSHPFEIYEFVSDLAEISPAVAGMALRACAPNLIETFESDLADAGSNIACWPFGIMLIVARLAESPSAVELDDALNNELEGHDFPTDVPPEQIAGRDDGSEATQSMSKRTIFECRLADLSAVVLDVMSSIDWESSARSLRGKKAYELHNLDILLFWLGQLSAEILDRIAAAIPLDWLYEATAADSPSEARNFGAIAGILQAFAYAPRAREIARSFLEAHEQDIAVFPPGLVTPFPDIAARLLSRGQVVGVESPSSRSKELSLDAGDASEEDQQEA